MKSSISKSIWAVPVIFSLGIGMVSGAEASAPANDLAPATLAKLRALVWGDTMIVTESVTLTYQPEVITEPIQAGDVVVVQESGVLKTSSGTIPVSEVIYSEPVTSEVVIVSEPVVEEVFTTVVSASVGKAEWNADSGTVIYLGDLSPEDKLYQLKQLYLLSIITPGVYHSERAKISLN